MSRRGGRPKRRTRVVEAPLGDGVIAVVEFPLEVEFPTEQNAVDFVAGVDEIKASDSRYRDCGCSIARHGRVLTVFPGDEEHAREIAVQAVRAGWLR